MKYIFLDSIDSTHLYVKAHKDTFKTTTCVVAEGQTGGIGQFQRRWISPFGVNLYVTFYLKIPKDTKALDTLAITLMQSVQEVLVLEGVNPTMKWPNDLLLNGKKIAGALCEVEFLQDAIEVIASFGLNVNMKEKDFALVDQPITSLFYETGKIWDRKLLLHKIAEQFLLRLIPKARNKFIFERFWY